MEMDNIRVPALHKHCQSQGACQIQRVSQTSFKAFQSLSPPPLPQRAAGRAYQRNAVAPAAQAHGQVQNLALAA
jgi:hypothetical protein